MSFITTNYTNNESNDYGALPTGNYEMVIHDVVEKATKNGKEAMTVRLIVRNDLKQVPKLAETNGKYANRYVFNDNWKREKPEGYVYDMESLMYILEAANVPEGTSFANFEELANALRGKAVNVYVKEEEDSYNGGTRNSVAPWGYKKSEFPQVQHTFKKDKQNGAADPYAAQAVTTADVEANLPF